MAKLQRKAGPAILTTVKALSLCAQGRLAEAEPLCIQVLKADPRDVGALMCLGYILRRRNRHAQAVPLLRRAATLAPRQADVHFNLGLCLEHTDDPNGAEAAYAREIAQNPRHALALNNLGNLVSRRGDLRRAEQLFRSAAQGNPKLAIAHFNLGNTLRSLDDLNGAVRSYRHALDAEPTHLGAALNLAVVCRDCGQIEEAEKLVLSALEKHPDSPEAHFNLSQLLLLKGDFAAGWKEYDWRLRAGPLQGRRSFEQPVWTGEDLTGKTLLLHTEQGLGDILQMLRFLPQVAKRGAQIVLEVPTPLERLCGALPIAMQVVCLGDPLPACDVQLPLMSLPGIFAAHEHNLPTAPYVVPTADETASWAARLADGLSAETPLKIGVVWSGSPTHMADTDRSLPAAIALPPLLRPDIRLYSLQKEIRATDRPTLDSLGGDVTDLSPHLTDFAATSAIVANLDLVIAADTSVAHLAGALGKPVWLLTPFAPDWRWMIGRDDNPWYPTMRLFRQPRRGDWASVMQEVSRALNQMESLS